MCATYISDNQTSGTILLHILQKNHIRSYMKKRHVNYILNSTAVKEDIKIKIQILFFRALVKNCLFQFNRASEIEKIHVLKNMNFNQLIPQGP